MDKEHYCDKIRGQYLLERVIREPCYEIVIDDYDQRYVASGMGYWMSGNGVVVEWLPSIVGKDSRLNNAFKLCQNEIAVVPDFHKRILFSDEAHFWLNGYVNKQNCRLWSEANPQVYVETPLHPEKLTVWCALWAGGILLQKR
ncbi:hypothetical protein TNCV_1405101 [Trichonephila clavipes]|nr:hypothetical protein TNCV_1405101 [Trichonephila clavipes]